MLLCGLGIGCETREREDEPNLEAQGRHLPAEIHKVVEESWPVEEEGQRAGGAAWVQAWRLEMPTEGWRNAETFEHSPGAWWTDEGRRQAGTQGKGPLGPIRQVKKLELDSGSTAGPWNCFLWG